MTIQTQQITEFTSQVQQDFMMTKQERADVIAKIRSYVRNYVSDNNIKSLVVGISGGLDSSVIAALLTQEHTGVPLIGMSIPMSSTNAHKEQADYIGKTYCTAFEEFNEFDERVYDRQTVGYTAFHESFFNILERSDKLAQKAGFDVKQFPKNILQGNVKARIRMITLFDIARKTNGLVLSTDQLSEELAGFWTLHGDVGDFSPIQKIWKGLELWQIAEELGIREDIITQPPSDGLGVTEDNTDEAQLGMNYLTFDSILTCYLADELTNNKVSEKSKELYSNIDESVKNIAIDRMKSTQFKRENPVVIQRNEIF